MYATIGITRPGLFHLFSILLEKNSAMVISSRRVTEINDNAVGALEIVYRNHYAQLVSYARLLVDDVASASDVVQEAFVKALVTKPAFTNDDALSYMKTAVMNQARSALRKRQVSRKHLQSVKLEREQVVSSPSENELPIDAKVIANALAQLPTRQRECVSLSHSFGMSQKEIALHLGISEGSVKQHLSRAMAKLHSSLKDER